MWAPGVARATPFGGRGAVSPAALDQRMNTRVLGFRPDMSRTTWAKRQAWAQRGEASLLAPCARVHLADRTV